MEFKHSVYAVAEVGGKSEDAAGKGFQGYLTIVQEFVEPDARSEVRLSRRTWCLKTAPKGVARRNKF